MDLISLNGSFNKYFLMESRLEDAIFKTKSKKLKEHILRIILRFIPIKGPISFHPFQI